MAAQWLKGNTHTHTDCSDGDAPLDQVAEWYQTHGYDFLVITDHNRVTDVGNWNSAEGNLLLLPGCEVSLYSEGKPVHVNSLGSAALPEFSPTESIAEALQRGVDAVHAAGGLAQINHPNYKWAFTHEQLRGVTNYHLLEVFNGSTDSNNVGGGGRPGVEEIWDRLLAAGHRIWGVAADDSHDFRREFWGYCSPPGRAWVMVRAEDRSAAAILTALERGDFYTSTEIVIDRIESDRDSIRLAIGESATTRTRRTSSVHQDCWAQTTARRQPTVRGAMKATFAPRCSHPTAAWPGRSRRSFNDPIAPQACSERFSG